MRSKVAKRILDKTPEETKVFVSWYAALVVKINQALEDKKMTQKTLADKLGKHPSEIHRWINGDHNFTLRSLARLQVELGEPLLEVPNQERIIKSTKKVNNVEWIVYKKSSLKHEAKVTAHNTVKTKFTNAIAEYNHAG